MLTCGLLGMLGVEKMIGFGVEITGEEKNICGFLAGPAGGNNLETGHSSIKRRNIDPGPPNRPEKIYPCPPQLLLACWGVDGLFLEAGGWAPPPDS